MTKIAAIGLPALLGVGLSVAGSLVSMAAQRSHAKKQEAANRDWMAYQDAKSRQFEKRDERERAKAQGELNQNLENQDIDARNEIISEEESRLSDVFGGSDENLANVTANLVGSGQGGGQSQVFDQEMARQLGNASSEAKKRIQAMARTTAYGGGSMGGQGVQTMLNNLNTQTMLGGINDVRRGNTDILRRYQTVEPEVIPFEGSPLGSALSAFGGAVGGMNFGGGLGGLGGGTATVGVPTPKPFQPTPLVGPVPTFNPMAPR